MEKSTAAASDARQITSALRRVQKAISSSVTSADEAVSVLLQDGAILEDTLQDHKYGLKSSLQTTKYRLDRIKSAETREVYSVFLSLSFFTSVVIYIVAKRTRLLTVAWLTVHGVIRGRNLMSSLTAKVSDLKEVSVLDLLSDRVSDHEGYQILLQTVPDSGNKRAENPIDLSTAYTADPIGVNVEGDAFLRDQPDGKSNLFGESMNERSALDTESGLLTVGKSEGNDDAQEIDVERVSASDYFFI